MYITPNIKKLKINKQSLRLNKTSIFFKNEKDNFLNRKIFGFWKISGFCTSSLSWGNQPFSNPCDSGRLLIMSPFNSCTGVATWNKLDQSDPLLGTQEEGQWSRFVWCCILEKLFTHSCCHNPQSCCDTCYP